MEYLSTHPMVMLGFGLGIMLIGAVPLIWGIRSILGMAFREEAPTWKLALICSFIAYAAGFLVETGDLRWIVGGAGMVVPLVVGFLFSRGIWKWAHRPYTLWVGGAFFYFAGLAVLYWRYTIFRGL